MCIWVCVWVPTHVCVHMGGGQRLASGTSSNTLHIIHWAGPLTGPRAPNCLDWLVSKFRESIVSGPPRLACKMMFFAWDFYILFLSYLCCVPLIVARSLMGHSGPLPYFLNIRVRSLTNTVTSAHGYDRHMMRHAQKDLRSLAYIPCSEVVPLFSHSSWGDGEQRRGSLKELMSLTPHGPTVIAEKVVAAKQAQGPDSCPPKV